MRLLIFLVFLTFISAALIIWMKNYREKFLASSAIGLYNNAGYCMPPSADGAFSGGCFTVGKVF